MVHRSMRRIKQMAEANKPVETPQAQPTAEVKEEKKSKGRKKAEAVTE